MDSNKKSNTRAMSRLHASPFALALLVLLCSAALRAQSVNLGGIAALGDFRNPLTVTDITPQVCNYDSIQIDLALGKVWARPYRNGSNAACNPTYVDITNVVGTVVSPSTTQTPFSIPPTGPINDGVLEVANFTLQQSTLTGASTPTWLYLSFRPNANNTPVWLRATGNVTISTGTWVLLTGSSGGARSGFLRGVGGAGGPGGFRGGDGGNGGLSPSAGGAGFGAGGGPGGAAGTSTCTVPPSGAQFITTGVTVTSSTGPAAAIPSGNDLLTMLRGGSGGGGQGGCTANPGNGGGGGGGAIQIAANSTITVSGALDASGGPGVYYNQSASGAGGSIRLVASTITGGGTMDVRQCNDSYCGIGSANGIIRLEAFTISYSGNLYGNVAAASSPGQIVSPTAQTAFLQFAAIRDSSNPTNACTVDNANACYNQASSQTVAGRSGIISTPDVTMPNPSGSTSTVTVEFILGPNTVAFPAAGKTVTLEVAPLDPAQGRKTSYQTSEITCPAAGAGNCTASITGVTLPLGYSSMSAFTVISLNSNGTLARNFPATYEGETIESVKLRTSGKDTEYVLISRTGREFPYKPGAKM
ncbi:MAG: hypothetical protein HYX72_09890 [Acidobacteria bacterium]|nr:hypothetical protein [Acidobacteriota bacterium]